MSARRLLAPALAAMLCVAAATAAAHTAQAANELARDAGSGLQYLEIVTGGAAMADALPIVVAMHGLGDRPESFRLLLDELPARARIIFPRGPIPHGQDGFSWFNFHADDAKGSAELVDGVHEASERVAKLIESVIAQHDGPPRVVVCGFSQGGMLSFALAAEHPELVAEAIPVAGYLPSPLWPAKRLTFKPLPTLLALHGDADPLIPVQWARWSVEALRSNGFTVELRSWPGVPHALSPAIHKALIASVVAAVQAISAAPAATENGPPAPATEAPSAPSKEPSVTPPGAAPPAQ